MRSKGQNGKNIADRGRVTDKKPDDNDQPSTSSQNVDGHQRSSRENPKKIVENSEYDADDEQDLLRNHLCDDLEGLTQEEFIDANCDESMPSSGEAVTLDSIDFSSTACNDVTGLPFPELLKTHQNQLVSGFEFGEAVKRQAQENMKSARDKTAADDSKPDDTTKDLNKNSSESKLDEPGSSKAVSESDHKTPHSHKRQRLGDDRENLQNLDIDFGNHSRSVPLPLRNHPACIEVWRFMVYKEEAASKLRNPRLFYDFKTVTPRMRAILLDWLMEVAEVYHLRRITYYLSVDYFDRFLSIRPDIPKSLLQLVGITCLYIAAKVEEIYPPNLSEFAYVCDGACKTKDMVSCEILILNSLGWEVIVMTPSDWLNLYMQLVHKAKDIIKTGLSLDFNNDFIFPQYSAYHFTRASQLMDLLSLDPCFLQYSYSTIAAAAIFFIYGKKTTLAITGLTWDQLKPCVQYMSVFHHTVEEANDPRLISCNVTSQPEDISKITEIKTGSRPDNYSFQTHIASMEYFEQATIERLHNLTKTKDVTTLQPESESVASNNDSKYQGSDFTCPQEESPAHEEAENNANILNNDSNNPKSSLLTENDSEKTDKSDKSGEAPSVDKNVMNIDAIFELLFSHEQSMLEHSK